MTPQFPKPKTSDSVFQLRRQSSYSQCSLVHALIYPLKQRSAEQLQQLGLSSQGKKETLLKRAKKAWSDLHDCDSVNTVIEPEEEEAEVDFYSTPKGVC